MSMKSPHKTWNQTCVCCSLFSLC